MREEYVIFLMLLTKHTESIHGVGIENGTLGLPELANFLVPFVKSNRNTLCVSCYRYREVQNGLNIRSYYDEWS